MNKLPALAALVLLVQGCAMTFTIDEFEPYEPAPGAKHAAAVDLCHPAELVETVVRVELADNFDGVLGPSLVAGAESCARAAFDDVRVVGAAVAERERGRLLVCFKGTATDLPSLYAFAEATTTIDLEWTLEDCSGNTVWLATVRGVGHANVGNAFSARSKMEDRFQQALDDVFARSLAALRDSPEIRAWVAAGRR